MWWEVKRNSSTSVHYVSPCSRILLGYKTIAQLKGKKAQRLLVWASWEWHCRSQRDALCWITVVSVTWLSLAHSAHVHCSLFLPCVLSVLKITCQFPALFKRINSPKLWSHCLIFLLLISGWLVPYRECGCWWRRVCYWDQFRVQGSGVREMCC